jgi:hypothetical protein
MTENLRSPEDMRNLGERLSGLSDEDLLAAGRRCQFDVAAQAERFGGFMAARAIVVALGARLQIEFGVHDGQLDAFVEALGPRLRAEVAANMMAGLAPGKDAMDALLAAIDRSGVAPDPIELRSLAAGYAVSRSRSSSLSSSAQAAATRDQQTAMLERSAYRTGAVEGDRPSQLSVYESRRLDAVRADETRRAGDTARRAMHPLTSAAARGGGQEEKPEFVRSHLLGRDVPGVLSAYRAQGFSLAQRGDIDGWATLVLRRGGA